jgi:hypothetical protein
MMLVAGVVLAAVSPQDWPGMFQIDITTNHSWIVDDSTPSSDWVNGTLYYDWTTQSQRVNHGAGNLECKHFYKTDLPCSLLMNPNGTYRILQHPLPPGQPECCLDIPTIPAPPPNWATKGQPTDAGSQVTVPYTGLATEKFLFKATGTCNDRQTGNNSGCHSYYEVLETTDMYPTPGLFTFPAGGGLQDWYFLADTMKVNASFPESIFALPSGCANRACPKTSADQRTSSVMPWASV